MLLIAYDRQDLTWVESSPYFGAKGGAEWEVRPIGNRFVRTLSTKQVCGVVDRLRFYKYEKGQEYPEHFDGRHDCLDITHCY